MPTADVATSAVSPPSANPAAPAQRRHDGSVDRIAPWLFGLGAALLAFAMTGRGGSHLSPDSIQYLSVASSLAHGHGFTAYDGQPLLVWPPGYPLLLGAVASVTPTHILGIAQGLNTMLAGLIGWLSWCLARRHLGPLTAVAVVAACLLANGGPIGTATFVWIEPMLIVATLWLILCLERIGDSSQTDARALIGAGVAGALVGLASYGGLQVILAAVLAVVLVPAADLKVRLRRAVVFGAIAGVPNIVWLARNVVISGRPAGPRVPAVYTVGSLVDQLRSLVRQLLFSAWPSRLGEVAAIAVLALMPVLGIAVVVRGVRARGSGPGRWDRVLTPLPVVTVVSTALLLASAVVTWVSFDARTLSRVLVLLVVLAAVWAQQCGVVVWARWDSRARRVVSAGAGGLALVGLAGLGVGLHDSATAPRADYSASVWTAKGPSLRQVVQGTEQVWSNQPDIVWKLTGHSARLLPQLKVHFDPHTPAEQLQRFERSARTGAPDVVIWFVGSSGALAPEPGLIRPLGQLRAVVAFGPRTTGPGWEAWRVTG